MPSQNTVLPEEVLENSPEMSTPSCSCSTISTTTRTKCQKTSTTSTTNFNSTTLSKCRYSCRHYPSQHQEHVEPDQRQRLQCRHQTRRRRYLIEPSTLSTAHTKSSVTAVRRFPLLCLLLMMCHRVDAQPINHSGW